MASPARRGVEHAVGPGMVTIFHPGRTFLTVADAADPWVRRHVWIRGGLVPELLHRYGLQGTAVLPEAHAGAFFDRMEGTARGDSTEDERQRALAGEVCALIIHLGAFAPPPPSNLSAPVARLRSFLDHHTHERIHLADLRRRHGERSEVLFRAFKKETGRTVYDYFLDRKIDHCKRLLGDPMRSLESIAEALRFTDAFHLSNLFRKRTGMSPSRFRETVGARAPTIPRRVLPPGTLRTPGAR